MRILVIDGQGGGIGRSLRILVIDGQGGGIGRSLVELLVKNFPDAEVGATGTNSIATETMLKGGPSFAATGENAARGNQPGYCHGSFFQQGKGGADPHESLPGLHCRRRRKEGCGISPGRCGHYTEDCGKMN